MNELILMSVFVSVFVLHGRAPVCAVLCCAVRA